MSKTVRLWYTVTFDVTYDDSVDVSDFEVTEDLNDYQAGLALHGWTIQDRGAYSVKRVNGVLITDPDGISVDSY